MTIQDMKTRSQLYDELSLVQASLNKNYLAQEDPQAKPNPLQARISQLVTQITTLQQDLDNGAL